MKRKSIARFREVFRGPRLLTAVISKFLPLTLLAALFGVLPLLASESGELNISQMLTQIEGQIAAFTSEQKNKWKDIESRLFSMEQRGDVRSRGGFGRDDASALGDLLIASDQFKAFVTGGLRSSGKIQLKTALVNSDLGSNLLVAPDRQAPARPIVRRLMIQDLLPSAPTNSNAIEFSRETGFTNNAAPQYSAGAYENVAKAESALSFELVNQPVSTIAHWIPVSNQLLEDGPAVAAYVNNRMLYGLRLKIEDELLNGSGIQGHLLGLTTEATSFSTGDYASTDSEIDTIRHAVKQLATSDVTPDFVVLNPADWDTILGTKEGSTNAYIFSDPRFQSRPVIWGLSVIITNSIAAGTFLVGDSSYAMSFIRSGVSVEVSREHSDFFVKNMSAILTESRLSLATFRSTAFIVGSFPFGS